MMIVGNYCGYSLFLHFCDRIYNIRDTWIGDEFDRLIRR